jgi:riboflavin synthase
VFTGLVAGTGTVESLEREGGGVRLRVRSELAGELEPGDSVAVNGVCLTAVEPDGDGFSADVME